MGDKDPLGSGGLDGGVQPIPIRVVGHDKAPVGPPSAPHPPQGHPAAGKGAGAVGPELPRPCAGQGRRRGQHHGPWVGLAVAAGGNANRVGQGDSLPAQHCIGVLDRAMCQDRPYGRVKQRHQPLRFAQRIGPQQRGSASGGIGAPPAVDLGLQDVGGGPFEDRKPKGAFGDEGVAGNRLERVGQAIVDDLVIARHHPDLAAHLDPDLGRSRDMARRVKRDQSPADLAGLGIGDGVRCDVTQPVAHDGGGGGGAKVGAHTGAGMVGMPMCDQRPGHRSPGINVEIAGRAVDAAIGKGQDCVHGAERSAVGGAGKGAWGLCLCPLCGRLPAKEEDNPCEQRVSRRGWRRARC